MDSCGCRQVMRGKSGTLHGKGTVDIHLKCVDEQGIIEVKSFVDSCQVETDREKAAWYAKSLGLDRVRVTMVAIRWG